MVLDGRFAYQPLNEEFAKDSVSGQLIMNYHNGHISANKNNIIVSITKEIEDKITDINELRHDVDEQTDVISNLLEDIEAFLEGLFEETVIQQNETYEFANKLLTKIRYLRNLDTGMRKKIDRIWEIIRDLRKANEMQEEWVEKFNSDIDLAEEKVGDLAYVENENNIIMSLKTTYGG
jgi:hypothetical protein